MILSAKIKHGIVFASIIAVASVPNVAEAAVATQCSTNLSRVAPCFKVHGRMSVWMGSPSIRIWRIGTKRMLGVVPSEHPIMPQGIWKHLAPGIYIYANYDVCPFTSRKPGHMQMVCVQSASKVVVQNFIKDDRHPKITQLPGKYVLEGDHSFKRSL